MTSANLIVDYFANELFVDDRLTTMRQSFIRYFFFILGIFPCFKATIAIFLNEPSLAEEKIFIDLIADE